MKSKAIKSTENNSGKNSRHAATRKYNRTLLGLCIPGIISLILFNYLPMCGIIIAFKDYNPIKGIFKSKWIGLDNFKYFFLSQDAFRTIRNTLLYSVEFLILDLVFGVLVAVLLYNLKSAKGVKIYHTIMLIPRFISIIVIAYMAYGFLNPTRGILNEIIKHFGGTEVSWYTEPAYWPAIITVVYIWKSLGAGCLYYYAALTGIDTALFEAAEIDGANVLQKTWHVAVPELIPIMVMTTILGIGAIFQGDIGLFYNVPRNTGLLYEATDIINTYTYRALLGGSLEKSAAVGLFQSIVGFILVVSTNAIIRKISPENSMF